MSTTLLAAEQLLSKELGDYWSSTTTGAGSTTTLVDSALLAKANDWITDETYAFLIEEPTGDAAIYDERKVSSLDNTTGTLTTLAFAGAPGTGIDYELHRQFTPSEKRRALVAAAKKIFPACFQEIWDETQISGNWLRDGSLERWTTSTDLTNWTDTTVTTTQTSTSLYYKHGAYSCKLSGAIGNIAQAITDFDDLKHLAGKSVTFTVQGWSDTASCLRLGIYDGTTYTYSSYHDGDSAWTEHNDPLSVTAVIKDNPTAITFYIYHDVATTATSYVDDARVISGDRSRLYIGHMGFAQNRPHRVYIEPSDYSQEEPWYMVRDWLVDKDGYLYLPASTASDYRLRLRGIGYLDFLVSGVSSTAWTATIALDSPQIEILAAEAALYLYTTMSMPNYEAGTRAAYQQMIPYWEAESAKRKAQFGMLAPGTAIHWGGG